MRPSSILLSVCKVVDDFDAKSSRVNPSVSVDRLDVLSIASGLTANW
jgi:hypothetical protein